MHVRNKYQKTEHKEKRKKKKKGKRKTQYHREKKECEIKGCIKNIQVKDMERQRRKNINSDKLYDGITKWKGENRINLQKGTKKQMRRRYKLNQFCKKTQKVGR